MTISTLGEHKVTVTVELANGTTVQDVVRFSSGNPLFHVSETEQAVARAESNVAKALTGIYGDVRNDR